jgi:hypothetical protein
LGSQNFPEQREGITGLHQRPEALAYGLAVIALLWFVFQLVPGLGYIGKQNDE